MGGLHDNHNLSLGDLLNEYSPDWLTAFGADTEGLLNSPYVSYLGEEHIWFIQSVNRLHGKTSSGLISAVINQIPLRREQLVSAVPVTGHTGIHPEQKVVDSFKMIMSRAKASIADQLTVLRISDPVAHSSLASRAMAINIKLKQKSEILALAFLTKELLTFPFSVWARYAAERIAERASIVQKQAEELKIFEEKCKKEFMRTVKLCMISWVALQQKKSDDFMDEFWQNCEDDDILKSGCLECLKEKPVPEQPEEQDEEFSHAPLFDS